VISDAVHNLRAALDYIVYELSRFNEGRVVNGTQFLIEDVKSDPSNPRHAFDARKGTRLRGLTDHQIRMVEALQPYNGTEWTESLRDISNPDKHRTLTALTAESGVFSVTATSVRRTRPRSGTGVHGLPADLTLEVNATAAIQLLPRDESKPPLIHLLRQIETEVFRTISLFEGEFVR